MRTALTKSELWYWSKYCKPDSEGIGCPPTAVQLISLELGLTNIIIVSND